MSCGEKNCLKMEIRCLVSRGVIRLGRGTARALASFYVDEVGRVPLGGVDFDIFFLSPEWLLFHSREGEGVGRSCNLFVSRNLWSSRLPREYDVSVGLAARADTILLPTTLTRVVRRGFKCWIGRGGWAARLHCFLFLFCSSSRASGLI